MIKAPFPWFGGKRKVAGVVWARFGDVGNYIEPFFGSGAVLLGRPTEPKVETINDADGFVCNFWRGVQADPDSVAHYVNWPVNENDLHARHSWLVGQRADLTQRLEGNPDYYDAKIAGWWVWGVCSWISAGWCSGKGPWHSTNGRLVKGANAGKGVKRTLPHLGDAGRGVNRQLPHLGTAGTGVVGWMRDLSDRLRRTRVCCGDWARVCSPAVLQAGNKCGVFLDPPYDESRCRDVYAVDSTTIFGEVVKWCIENGDNPSLRIALCGYEGPHGIPDSWTTYCWKAHQGYSRGENENRNRERIWFSPHCLPIDAQSSLFSEAG